MAQPALVLLNPAAGSCRWRSAPGRASSDLERLLDLLRASGFEPRACFTERPGHATELARQAADGGAVEVVFAVGGDGLIREAAIGLLDREVALGLLPSGTANVLARSFAIPRNPFQAAEAYAGLTCADARQFDVGLLGKHPFLMMASRGIDANTLHALPRRLKRRLGRSGVLLCGLRELLRGTPARFELSVGTEVLVATFASICNVPNYGGSIPLAPAASPFDRKLDLVAFSGVGRAAAVSFALAVAMGRHQRNPRVAIRKVDQVDLLGTGRTLVQLDGDAFEVALPARIVLASQRLRLLVPKAEGDLGPTLCSTLSRSAGTLLLAPFF